MRRIILTAAATLAAVAFTAAPAGAAEEPKYCDPGPCLDDAIMRKVDGLAGPTVDKAVWTVTCAGYALGGDPCTGQ